MTRKAIFILGTLAVIGVVAFKVADGLYKNLHVSLPRYEQPKKVVWLDQNLSVDKRNWYYHADQGTRTFGIPYEWFVAMEQPEISLSAAGLFSDPAYLDRYGFIANSAGPEKPPLPIGMAHGGTMMTASGEPWLNPKTKQPTSGIGLTCSACHTGRFSYKGTAVVIDGGSALIDLFKLKQGIGAALFFTRYLPGRFDHFADRILGPGASDAERTALKDQIDAALQQMKKMSDLENSVAAKSVEEGYGRLDALNRIGNQVFSVDLNNPGNYAPHSAPVHYPRIWNAPWFSWVQYNGSIEQPIVRNVGEALGVSADLNLTRAEKGIYASSAHIKTLAEIEQTIAGEQPTAERGFSGLKSPSWPKDILPAIDQQRAAHGAALYKEICQDCHMPPVKTPEFFQSPRWLAPNAAGERVLDLELIPLQHIGTDPSQAVGMKNRKVNLPASLAIGTNEFGPALGLLVEKTVNYWYGRQIPAVTDTDRQRISGSRANGIQAPLAYKVRPLNGVWATPPYLHNGSVPNVYALLSPVAERPAKFYLGNREYDPVDLGYRTDSLDNGFEFDTSLPGNSNHGHEFSDQKRDGVIGRALSPDERKALIEYLKTL
jgi:cytochrome c5